MLIPWGSDAPLYHRPYATVALVVLNVAAFLAMPRGGYADWVLVLGDGVHPVQWLTNLFLHAGWGHLIGNMIFLWTFGMVVEGKLGSFGFLLVYLGLGVAESAGLQLLVKSDEPVRMLGTSGIIFGLLAMCVVWAPLNEVLCIAFFRFTAREFELSILWFVAFYIVLDIASASVQGVVMANLMEHSRGAILALALDHSSGAILGFVLAVVLLKLKLVDCENWDFFAVIQGRQGRSSKRARSRKLSSHHVSVEFDRPATPKKKPKPAGAARRAKSVEEPRAAALRAMRLHLELGEVEAAVSVYQQSSRKFADWALPQPDWRELIQAVLDQEDWAGAASLMRDYVEKTEEPSPRIRLKLAQVLIQKLARPLQGLKVLNQIPIAELPAELVPRHRELQKAAEHMCEEGDLELQDEMW
jgi:membrane associated rhomboid family serine protease